MLKIMFKIFKKYIPTTKYKVFKKITIKSKILNFEFFEYKFENFKLQQIKLKSLINNIFLVKHENLCIKSHFKTKTQFRIFRS